MVSRLLFGIVLEGFILSIMAYHMPDMSLIILPLAVYSIARFRHAYSVDTRDGKRVICRMYDEYCTIVKWDIIVASIVMILLGAWAAIPVMATLIGALHLISRPIGRSADYLEDLEESEIYCERLDENARKEAYKGQQGPVMMEPGKIRWVERKVATLTLEQQRYAEPMDN